MDLLLINPNSSGAFGDLATDHAAIEPPIWAGLLATYIKRKGYSVDILDANAIRERYCVPDIASSVKYFNPRLVAITCYGSQPSASTQTMPAAYATAQKIRERCDTPIILIGGHVAALPELTALETGVFVATGEGALSLLDLLENRAVPRGVMRERVSTTPAPLITDLDNEMPGIDWSMLPMEKYRCHDWATGFVNEGRSSYWSIYSSLSCQFNCSFCCIQAPFKNAPNAKLNGYREWSPSVVVDSIERAVLDHNAINGKLADELPRPKHLEAICDEMIKRGLGDKTKWWAYQRPDTVNERLIQKFREAGGHTLGFGVESASAAVRDGVDKGYKQDCIARVREWCRKHDVGFGCNLIFGLPDDTLESMQATLALAMDLLPEYVNMYSTMAYPGSPLYDQVSKDNPEWLPDSWIGYSQHHYETKPLPTKYLSAAEVLRFRDQAWLDYHTYQPYLDLLARKYGPQAVEATMRMAEIKIKRKLLGD